MSAPTPRLTHALRLAVPLVLGCSAGDLIPPALPDQADLYWDLELNHHAVVLSTTKPYDTLQLIGIPRNYRNEPLSGLGSPRFYSSNPDRVIVTSDGLLIAAGRTTQPVAVVATLKTFNLEHSDTVIVSVVEDSAPPAIASFSIHPLPPDSAKAPVTYSSPFFQPKDTLRARAFTAEGEAIPVYLQDTNGYLPMYYRAEDTTVITIDQQRIGIEIPATIVGMRPGTSKIYASTTAFGVRMEDTLTYRIGVPIFTKITLMPISISGGVGTYNTSYPPIMVGTGGLVSWAFDLQLLWNPPATPDTIDITFADADLPNILSARPMYEFVKTFEEGMANTYFCRTDCDGSGNVLLTTDAFSVARRFSVPGTYEYHSKRKGMRGRVIVVDER